MNGKLKVGLVVVGAMVLSTVAINASDVLRGIDGSLAGLVIDSTSGPCGEYAVLHQFGEYGLCVDAYEASPAAECPSVDPQSEVQTRENISTDACVPVSVPDVIPWRFVSMTQAQQLCARTGKRLPTNNEWYRAVSGMSNVSGCAIDTKETQPVQTGGGSCATPSGVHDMVGNVWEWVDGQVNDGVYDERAMPETGFVAVVDKDGIVLETADSPSDDFGNDYARTNTSGVYGMMRGGFYASGEDAGMFALNASVPLDLRSAGVGFRCVKDI